jgi:hypothetical protein
MGRRVASVVALILGFVVGCSASVVTTDAAITNASSTLSVAECDDTGGCGQGVWFDGRFYDLSCSLGVRPEALGATVATGNGPYREARAIEGLPTTDWLAVTGPLPCELADGELDFEWYLVETEAVSRRPVPTHAADAILR